MSGLGYEQFPKEIFSLHPKDPIFSLELSLSTLAIARVLELIKFNSSPLKLWWLRTTIHFNNNVGNSCHFLWILYPVLVPPYDCACKDTGGNLGFGK